MKSHFATEPGAESLGEFVLLFLVQGEGTGDLDLDQLFLARP